LSAFERVQSGWLISPRKLIRGKSKAPAQPLALSRASRRPPHARPPALLLSVRTCTMTPLGRSRSRIFGWAGGWVGGWVGGYVEWALQGSHVHAPQNPTPPQTLARPRTPNTSPAPSKTATPTPIPQPLHPHNPTPPLTHRCWRMRS